jgi:hypothetical protein
MGQPLELHLQDGLGLDLRQLENGGMPELFRLGLRPILYSASEVPQTG